MNSCILLSHVFVRPDEPYKLKQIEFAVKHYRLHNPDSYIILTGHGVLPSNSTFDLCDFIHWDRIIKEEEIGKGHPQLVNIGLEHAIQKEFIWVFKCRSDSVILRPDIVEYCSKLLDDKRILLTQQTEFDRPRAGDLFMFGQTHFLKRCWDITTWYPTQNGLTSFAKNIAAACSMQLSDWVRCLLFNASFADIYSIKWVDLGYNWGELKSKQDEIMDNQLELYEKYLWGTKEGAHSFDKNGNMTSHLGPLISEKIWRERVIYENNRSSWKLDRPESKH